MHRSPSYENLLSVAISAMLTSAFLATAPSSFVSAAAGPQPSAILGAAQALKSEGWHGVQSIDLPSAIPTPAPAAAPSKATLPQSQALSDEQLKALLIDTAANGTDATMTAEIGASLGIGTAGQATKLHADGFTDDDKVGHAFAPLPAQPGFVVWRKNADGKQVRFFRVDAKLKLVRSALLDGDTVTEVALPDAQKSLDGEWAFWRAEIDSGFK